MRFPISLHSLRLLTLQDISFQLSSSHFRIHSIRLQLSCRLQPIYGFHLIYQAELACYFIFPFLLLLFMHFRSGVFILRFRHAFSSPPDATIMLRTLKTDLRLTPSSSNENDMQPPRDAARVLHV